MMPELKSLRENFPTLRADDAPIYLDNACMTLRPQSVIDAVGTYYSKHPSCGGRSIHRYANQVSQKMADSRRKMASFINSPSAEQVIFTQNTTNSLNQVAKGLSWQEGDIVLTSDREHNSNLIPWLQLEREQGIDHRVVTSLPNNLFDMEAFEAACADAGGRLRLVSMPQVGNLDGVEYPIKEIASVAHDHGAMMMVDAAQSAPHMPLDVQRMDIDFMAFSVHKMLGPSGVGILWGKEELLQDMRTLSAGGETVKWSEYEDLEWAGIPHRFEGGLSNYAGIIGAGAAIDYLEKVGMQRIHEHETKLNDILTNGVKDLQGISIIGPEDAKLRGGICSMLLDGFEAHELAIVLDESANIMVRSGMHCVHSWFRSRGIEDGSLRASCYFYNTEDEINTMVETMQELHSVLF